MVVQHEMKIQLSSGDVECMQMFAQRLRSILVSLRHGETITSEMIDSIDYLGSDYSSFVYEFFHLFD